MRAGIIAGGLSGRVISKPFAQRVGVGNGCFPEAKSNANLGMHTFGRTACKECLTIHRSPHVELLAQCRDSLRIDFGLMSWESAAITEEGQ